MSRRTLPGDLAGVLEHVTTPARLARFEVLCASVAELSWACAPTPLTLELHGRVHAAGCANPHVSLVSGTAPATALLAWKRAKRAERLLARCACWSEAPGDLARWEDAVSWLSDHDQQISTWLNWRGKLEQVQAGRFHPMSLASSVSRRSAVSAGLEGVWRADLAEARRLVQESWRESQRRGALGFDEELLWREMGSERGALLAGALVLPDEEPVQLLVPTATWGALHAFALLLGEEFASGAAGWVGWVPGQFAHVLGGFSVHEPLEETQARLVLELLSSEHHVRQRHVTRACETAREVMLTL